MSNIFGILRGLQESINDYKKFNRKISDTDIEERLQKLLFVRYLEEVQKGKIFDLKKISRQKEAYERAHPKDKTINIRSYFCTLSYKQLGTIFTKPTQFVIGQDVIEGIINNPVTLYKYVRERMENLEEENGYYLSYVSEKKINKRMQSLKDVQRLINLCEKGTRAKELLENIPQMKDNSFAKGIERLKFSITRSQAEKEENKLLKQYDKDR